MKEIISNAISIYKNLVIAKENTTCRVSILAHLHNSTIGNYVGIFGSPTILNSSVGDYTYIQTQSRIFNCSIGKFCSIGARVTTAPGKHELNFISTSPCLLYNNTIVPKSYNTDNEYDYNQRVVIENDVWIGEGAIILEGVTVRTGAVIGAYAVVTKDVEPYAVVGGIPAKLIKYRFSREIINELLLSKWWNNNEQWFLKDKYLFRESNLSTEMIKDICNGISD